MSMFSAARETKASTDTMDYVTLMIEDQMFGIPVLQVQDVMAEVRVTRVPLAPPEVAGSLNLRGRIVTAIDVRKRLKLPARAAGEKRMNVVVENGGELYSLIVDSVGEVLSLPKDHFENNPPTLATHLRGISKGIFQLDNRLLVVIDIPVFLTFTTPELAA